MANKPLLHFAPESPPCLSVLMTAAALGIDLNLRSLNLKAGQHLTPEFIKLNPLHTVPVLDDNGLIVIDSHVICSYLVDKYADTDALYPKETSKRMQVDARLFFDCSHLFPRISAMLVPVLHFGATDIAQEKIAYTQYAYDALENCLATGEYLCGDDMTIADFSCIASVSVALLYAPIDEGKFPKLSAWIERLVALPYYEKTIGEGVQILFDSVQEKLKEKF